MNKPFRIVGRLNGSFSELHAAGCIQTGADSCPELSEAIKEFGTLFAMLQIATGGNVCDGCPKADWNRPTRIEQVQCKAFQKYHSMARYEHAKRKIQLESATSPPGTDQFPGLSVAQIADRLGVSKSEVRRRKQAGTI